MPTKPFSWTLYWMPASACLAVTMRLVPMSKPIALVLLTSFFTSVLLVGGRTVEGRDPCLVALPQQPFILCDREMARGCGFIYPGVGEGQSPPERRAGAADVRGVVIEAEQVECGQRLLVIVRQPGLLEREISAPIGVPSDAHVVGIYRDLGVGDTVAGRQVVLAAKHFRQDSGCVHLGGIQRLVAGSRLRFETDPEKAAIQIE